MACECTGQNTRRHSEFRGVEDLVERFRLLRSMRFRLFRSVRLQADLREVRPKPDTTHYEEVEPL